MASEGQCRLCVFWDTHCVSCPNYEVERVVQTALQPQTAATTVLDSGFPMLIL